ncbi:uncharacterized protein E0L32_004406 [Thyridium curvatum]|uniref:Uncharacterized protein n=1 Tax=Thyridium curvatum TaxID=1093900 RepID=A0A507B8G1_9PEZI|nr:uncharacterized protein E0L32_004406 [Thyridium curvatum]TPX15426.1 hypothetical protein E0L32_004406 [Thyridium curvatum]
MAFAAAAAGPGNEATVSCNSEPAGTISSISSQSHDASGAEQSTSEEQNSPSPVSTAPSIDDINSSLDPFIPAGTKKYMLLCVNTGLRQIKLANVDVTDADDGLEIFQRLRKAYVELRGNKAMNRLMKPTTMHYVKVREAGAPVQILEEETNVDACTVPTLSSPQVRGVRRELHYRFHPI